ncbi:Asp23/Gls24 family envelope stress response protein [Companilactobacillus nodensis]|uniref:Alkaline shock protein, Gls24 family n=1 Tax=Companilactobacillus nodensis DSM 19682 = JCM 14932 = NBRC 107160 TaxID=1423775 RepID=A0A0R1K8H1_9LACO|nr:Asp23/Gls24 family envelope stress response protein [Companilactobacillus nodensis]KRK79967.1 alkaline shock protein, Gls24 family [Companilactobacillus nodensis DSM 19682 = JCM 14932 = NBRC 107160]
MAEQKYVSLQQDSGKVKGNVEISHQVIEILLGIATNQVDGVYEMRGTLSNRIDSLFGIINHGKGVDVVFDDDKISANVFVYLEYGVSIPKVSLEIQKSAIEQLEFMTDLALKEINVHVVGLIAKKESGEVERVTTDKKE